MWKLWEKRISRIIDKEIEIKNDPDLPNLEISNCDISYKDVNFKYDTTNDKAIKNLNLEIKGGTMTALVGHSGAGKSTIFSLLLKFLSPQRGRILINGSDIEETITSQVI